MSHVSVASRPRWAPLAAAVAVGFGALTLASGGMVLFSGAARRAAMGDVVPFVLWFNFLSGFLYVLAGIGLFRWKRWSAWLSIAIAATILAVFAALGWHVVAGGAFEMRTVAAMTARSAVWIAIAAAAHQAFSSIEANLNGSDTRMNGIGQ